MEIPLLVHILVPLRPAFLNLLLPLLSSPVQAFIGSEITHELFDHVLERLFTSNTVFSLCLLLILGLFRNNIRSQIKSSVILRPESLLLDILGLFLELSLYETLNNFSGDDTSLLLRLLAARRGLVLLLGN